MIFLKQLTLQKKILKVKLKNKTKLYDTFPGLKEMEEKFSPKAEEMKSTIKETIDNAKSSF